MRYYIPQKPAIKRSPQWPALRKRWLADNPVCSICGRKQSLQVHHIKPVHLFPELELDNSNLITLCESMRQCHWACGHLWDWNKYNVNIKAICDLMSTGLAPR